MIPIVQIMQATTPVPHNLLWWALSLGACFGGNLTMIGASANIVATGMSRKLGYEITFLEFFRSSAVITLNGTSIVRPDEFNKNISHIQKPVDVRAHNTLVVVLRSSPGRGLTIEIIGLDSTPPAIAALATPPPNPAGWNKTDVTVTFVCSDTTSGVASCPGPVQVGQEGANQLITGTAMDVAGNMASASVSVSLDRTAPVVTIVSPPSGGTGG